MLHTAVSVQGIAAKSTDQFLLFFFASSRCCESIDVPCVPLSVYHKLMYGTRYEGGMGFRLERSWDLCSSRNIMFFIPFLCADRKRLVRKSSQTYT